MTPLRALVRTVIQRTTIARTARDRQLAAPSPTATQPVSDRRPLDVEPALIVLHRLR